MNFDSVIEGGSVKGMAHVGAFSSLESHGFAPARLAGTSAGAIVAAAIAAGYTPAEMRQIMMELDFREFQDGSRWKVKKAWDAISRLGIYEGNAFLAWMEKLLADKGVSTFGDLSSPYTTDPRYRWKLKVIVSDISKKRLVILPDHAYEYNINPDRLSVAGAVRASMAIPFYFMPVMMRKSLLVDGGALSNFPIWIFDSDNEPRFPTFGLLLSEDIQEREVVTKRNAFKRAFNFGRDLVDTMIQAHDRKFIDPGDFTHRTISIPVGDVGTTEFDLSQERKNMLYFHGRDAADDFLKTWSWEDYKEWRTDR